MPIFWNILLQVFAISLSLLPIEFKIGIRVACRLGQRIIFVNEEALKTRSRLLKSYVKIMLVNNVEAECVFLVLFQNDHSNSLLLSASTRINVITIDVSGPSLQVLK